MKNWQIFGHHLAYRDDSGNLYHPSAAEIFGLRQEDREINEVTENLGISFSRLCAQIECSVFFDGENIRLVFEVFAIHKGKKVPVDFVDGKPLDYVLINDRWMYLGESILCLQEILGKTKVKQSGEICFDDYLVLKRELSFKGSIRFFDTVCADDILKLSAEEPLVPASLNAELFSYQKEGFEWMAKTIDIAHGFLLGDEMGLGKTLQIITLLLFYAAKGNIHALIVAPVSLLINWGREISRFAPMLTYRIHSSSKRTGFYKNLMDVDVIITSYGTAVRDLSMLKMIKWDFLILDEGQNIKNPLSERSIQIKKIPRKNSIVMSGTPFENHLTDIWSIYDFIRPGLLDDLSTFSKVYKDDVMDAKLIEPILSPFMIRRKVADVRQDLPEKIIDEEILLMGDDEIALYEGIRGAQADGGDKLGVLTRLRLACTHPFLVDDTLPRDDPAKYSSKYTRFIEIVEEIIANDEKLIVFTTFRKMNEMIVHDIRVRFGVFTASIDGSTSDRQGIIDDFSTRKGSAVLVVNPKAGGAGLNITAATHVIHYNLEWNPAVENQASARAYRTGQKHTVVIHRLYYADTVEEYIDDLMKHKTEIGESAVKGTCGTDEFNMDLIQALMKSPGGLL